MKKSSIEKLAEMIAEIVYEKLKKDLLSENFKSTGGNRSHVSENSEAITSVSDIFKKVDPIRNPVSLPPTDSWQNENTRPVEVKNDFLNIFPSLKNKDFSKIVKKSEEISKKRYGN